MLAVDGLGWRGQAVVVCSRLLSCALFDGGNGRIRTTLRSDRWVWDLSWAAGLLWECSGAFDSESLSDNPRGSQLGRNANPVSVASPAPPNANAEAHQNVEAHARKGAAKASEMNSKDPEGEKQADDDTVNYCQHSTTIRWRSDYVDEALLSYASWIQFVVAVSGNLWMCASRRTRAVVVLSCVLFDRGEWENLQDALIGPSGPWRYCGPVCLGVFTSIRPVSHSPISCSSLRALPFFPSPPSLPFHPLPPGYS
ncbi:hypothetical protein IWX90DRAFT_425678 [Phyllosticta citrichinensis]|uniref:Uncharacterized protein n=1 Tax=Phyllosticta citrichinensis TaxID=1130410 RepID=A0ABR1Y448_9PEZI